MNLCATRFVTGHSPTVHVMGDGSSDKRPMISTPAMRALHFCLSLDTHTHDLFNVLATV